MALSGKQQAFIEHYLQCWNATEAAKRAGYSEKTAYSIGSENLKKPEIDAAIKVRIGELKASADEVLLRLAEHARGDLSQFLSLSVAEIQAHPQGRLLKKFKRETRYIKDDRIETIELELYDAQAALVHLAKASGAFNPDDETLTIEIKGAKERLEHLVNRFAAAASPDGDPAKPE